MLHEAPPLRIAKTEEETIAGVEAPRPGWNSTATPDWIYSLLCSFFRGEEETLSKNDGYGKKSA